jgi:hypothetical protein
MADILNFKFKTKKAFKNLSKNIDKIVYGS